MADEANGRVTTKEFYHAQIETNSRISELELSMEQKFNIVFTKLDEVHTTVAVSCKDHEKFHDDIEKMKGRQDDIEEDLNEHKLGDNRWKGITGFIQMVVAGILGWVATSK